MTWKSPLALFKAALKHEQFITAKINALMDIAMKEKDYASKTMLQWFVDEQVEEEDNAGRNVRNLELTKDSGHGMLMVDREMAGRIRNAGSVFLGQYTPESAGDYASGTNHTLPTGGYARAYSGLGLDSFMKRMTFQEISREGLREIGPAIMELAREEQLEAHRRAVEIRFTEA